MFLFYNHYGSLSFVEMTTVCIRLEGLKTVIINKH